MASFSPFIRGYRNIYGGLVEVTVRNEVASFYLEFGVLEFSTKIGLYSQTAFSAFDRDNLLFRETKINRFS